MEQAILQPEKQSRLSILALLALIATAWLDAYNLIQPLAEWIVYAALGLGRGSQLGDALAFFLYDVPEIMLLLSGMIFLIAIIRTFFSPERTRPCWAGSDRGLAMCWLPCPG